MVVHFDVGFKNSVDRGKGAGLSWDKGVQLKNTKPDEWVWIHSHLIHANSKSSSTTPSMYNETTSCMWVHDHPSFLNTYERR